MLQIVTSLIDDASLALDRIVIYSFIVIYSNVIMIVNYYLKTFIAKATGNYCVMAEQQHFTNMLKEILGQKD
jgi:hypothetical protein